MNNIIHDIVEASQRTIDAGMELIREAGAVVRLAKTEIMRLRAMNAVVFGALKQVSADPHRDELSPQTKQAVEAAIATAEDA